MDCKSRYDSQVKKRRRRTTRELTTPLLMLRAKQMNLTLDELNLLNTGDVIDMLTEQGNDSFKYPYKATQADIDKLFG